MAAITTTDPVPFGEWRPDLGDFANPGSINAKNVLVEGEFYKSVASLVEGADALPSKCKGAFAYRDAIGNVTIFAGTKTKLYKLNGTSWDDITRTTGGDYTLSDENFWHFVSFGNDVYATSYVDDIQSYTVGSSTEFAQLSATAPRCRKMAIFKNFLVCIDVVDLDGARGYRVRWSPLNNPAGDWTNDPTGTQADHQDIYNGDYANTGIEGLQDFAVIIQGKAIFRMDYVGGTQIFTFNKVETGRGSLIPRSIISNGRNVFMISEDGIYMFDGANMIPIGDKKVDKWFYANFNETYDYNVSSCIDPLKKNILWAFPSKDTVGGGCDLILVYNWASNRFSYIEEDVELLFTYLSSSYTLEDLDAFSSSIDDLPYSLDSRYWTGGKNIFGAFSPNHKLSAFNGDAKTGIIGTTELRPNGGGRATIYNAIPYIEGGTFRARLGYRNKITDAYTWTEYVSENQFTGEADFLHDAQLFRFEIELSGDWDMAKLVAFRLKQTGRA